MNCSSRKRQWSPWVSLNEKEDFNLDDITVSKTFNLKTVSSETFIRSFQCKFLDDIIYTNVRFANIGYTPKDTCTFCEVDSETVPQFEDLWFALSNEHEELLQRGVFMGKLGKSDLLNYFIIL